MANEVSNAFRLAFFPTPEEARRQKEFLHELIKESRGESRAYLSEQGLNEDEISILEELESEEASKVSRFQSYSNRDSLLRSGIITIERVKDDIRKYKENT
ncbi:hypothetical protein [Paenibacillus sp. QZ-Y1]|uniref:hypothetical protein n=1 Tax=Paenibacillus sp. QZ-Y1 TaxID=3414511 RepID=UPI003F7940C8